MEYKLGRANPVANALSCKGELTDIGQPQRSLRDHIKEGLQYDSLA